MALLDPSIPLQQRGLLLRDPLEMYAQVSRTRALNEESARRNQEQELQMQQVRQQMEDQAAERELFSDPSRFMRPSSPAVNPSEMDPEGAPAGQARFDPTLVQSALLQSRNPALVRKGVELASKGEEAYTLSPGAVRYVGGRQVAANPSAEGGGSPVAKLISEMERFPPGHPMRAVYENAIKKATEHPPATTVNTYGSPVPYALPGGGVGYVQPGNRPGAPPMVMTDPTTRQPFVKPPDSKPMTDEQAKAALYAKRMDEADKVINSLEGKYSRVALSARQMAGEGAVGAVANSRLPPEAQKIDQAQRNFINAVLRRESGAVISPSEFANARQQYFPQPGDSDEVIQQKAQNRRSAIEGIAVAAGPKAPGNSGNVIRYDAQGNRIQ